MGWLDSLFSAGGLGDALTRAILGSLVNTGMAMAANRLMAPQPQRLRLPAPAQPAQPMFPAPEVRQMIQQAREPIRTPEQVRSDVARAEGQEMALGSYKELAKEYQGIQEKGPLWNPYEEEQITRTVAGKHALRGTAESGAYFEDLRRALDEYRLKATGTWGERLQGLRGQMTPYLNVLGPSAPTLAPMPSIPMVGGQGGTEAYAPYTEPKGGVTPALAGIYPLMAPPPAKKKKEEEDLIYGTLPT